MNDAAGKSFIDLTTSIVSAYLSNNPTPASEIPGLISQIHAALLRVSTGRVETPLEPAKPAVSVKKSMTPDYLVCLEDGKRFKSLKRHLRSQYNMTPEQYREKWGLPPDRALGRDFDEVAELQVSKKGAADYVSAADLKAEQTLIEELTKARPGYSFLGEERGLIEGSDKTHTWIVDPLDGTTNFLHAMPHFAINIALQREGQIVAGVTYNPANADLFWAERGRGAYLNDRRLRVAARTRLEEA